MEKLVQSKHVKLESEDPDATATNETVEDISQDLEESKEQGIAPRTGSLTAVAIASLVRSEILAIAEPHMCAPHSNVSNRKTVRDYI
jgi:hypothetical protein